MVASVVKLRRQVTGTILQGCDVYIGRRATLGGWNLPKSKWANPFRVPRHSSPPGLTLQSYARYLSRHSDLLAALPELSNKVLGCWCAPHPCHGDVLREFELLNRHQGDPFVLEDSLWGYEYDRDGVSPITPSSSKEHMALPQGRHTATIIGVTQLRGMYVSVTAILEDGTLFRPVPLDKRLVATDPLAVVYTEFEFTAAPPPEGSVYPHRLNDVGLADLKITGCKSDHSQVLAGLRKRMKTKHLAEQDNALLEALIQRPYVQTGTRLPSTIIAPPESDIRVLKSPESSRLRAILTLGGCSRDLPVVSCGVLEKFEKSRFQPFVIPQDSIEFVRIGLARPWLPDNVEFEQPRCYSVLEGVINVKDIL